MNAPPIRAVLAHYGVDLGRERREQQIRCPVHDESHPSCSVNEEKGLLNCKACGFGGDVYSLIQEKEGLGDDFAAAVAFAEAITGEKYSGIPKPGGRPHKGVPGKPGAARGYRPAALRRSHFSAS